MDDTQDWPGFLKALASPDQPRAVFAAAEAVTAARIGVRLFTATVVENAAGDVRRIYSNHPFAYPVSGRKPGSPGAWADHVMVARRHFVANSIEAIAEVFPDHEQIAALGCGSVLNIPVVVADAVLGTINLLDVPGHYTPARVEAALALRGMYALAVLAAFATEAHPILAV